MQHSIVTQVPGMYSGWPANGGLWQWDNEILVSFNHGFYATHPWSHHIDSDRPISAAFARSMDGGETWALELPDTALLSQPPLPVPPGGFDFSAEGFVLRVGRPAVAIRGDIYIVSQDRGKTWSGPYAFPGAEGELTSRTCYLTDGPKTMLQFSSYADPRLAAFSYQDQCFPFLTEDGGQTWRRLPNLTQDLARAAMPSVVRMRDGTLVAALRRKTDVLLCTPEEAEAIRAQNKKVPREEDNWIEVVVSRDNARTWVFASRAAETSNPLGRNGNPPALAVLPDDRLVLAYGYRGDMPAIKARVSNDGGFTWGDEILIRSDARHYDIGYPRIAVRPDGKVLIVYYFTSQALPQQHIEATILSL